jgi:hypothetical protein
MEEIMMEKEKFFSFKKQKKKGKLHEMKNKIE